MARTTAPAVKAVLKGNYDGSADLTSEIDTATILVDDVVFCAAAKGITLSVAKLERIEAYLAAHLYGHSDQFLSSKNTGKAGGSFQGQTAMSLESSQYGQTAMTLDTSGCLRQMNKGQRADVVWLGKKPSEEIPYDQRD